MGPSRLGAEGMALRVRGLVLRVRKYFHAVANPGALSPNRLAEMRNFVDLPPIIGEFRLHWPVTFSFNYKVGVPPLE